MFYDLSNKYSLYQEVDHPQRTIVVMPAHIKSGATPEKLE
jgi:hypothetical protein